MLINQQPPSMVGLGCALVGSAAGTAASLYKMTADATITPPGLPAVDVNATNGLILSISVGVIGLFTQIANGYFANRKLKRDVEDRLAKAETEAADARAEAARIAADARAEADRKIADAKAEALRVAEDARAQAARLAGDAEDAAARRKAEREFNQVEMLKLETMNRNLRAEIEQLKRRSDYTEPRVDRNVAAVDELAAEAGVDVPPAPVAIDRPRIAPGPIAMPMNPSPPPP